MCCRSPGRSSSGALAQALVWFAVLAGAAWAQEPPANRVDRAQMLRRVPAQIQTQTQTQAPAPGTRRGDQGNAAQTVPARNPLRMPSLAGITCREAQALMAQRYHQQLACEPGEATGRFPVARINRQEPPAGSVLGTDVAARAWTETQPAVTLTTVPQVTGMPALTAVQRIGQAGLQSGADAGTPDRWHWVEAQSPSAGTRVPPQTTVRLRLLPRYRVPDLTGQTCGGARQMVMGAGLSQFQCDVVAGPGSAPSGLIYGQSPAAGTVLNSMQVVRATQQPVQVTVPDVVGMSESQAGAVLGQRNLQASPSGPTASAGRQVARQVPQAGASVAPGSAVSLTMALTVPALGGLDCNDARIRARAHGFDVLNCSERFADASQPLHRVFEQAPRAGAALAAPQAIEAVAARAVKVPNVVGLGLKDALATLDGAMLQGRPDGSEGDRDVRTQRPAAGDEAPPRSAVVLTTQRFATVPPVVGLMLSDARARLQSAALADTPDHADRAASRKVDEQRPAAGERVALGASVALVTHVEVVVPDVLLQRLPAASATLRQGGLQPRPDRDDRDSEREVRSQMPEAGTSVRENSDVVLTTVRMVVVPGFVGQTCDSAAQKARDEVTLRCKVDSILPLSLGQPTITSQPTFDGPVEEGTAVEVLAAPPWWSTPTLLTMLVSGMGGLGWGGRSLIRRFLRPLPVPPVPPTLQWRLAPDLAPALSLRLGGPVNRDAAGPRMNWRVSADEPLVCLRGLGSLAGEEA